ncbi:hypothetical protein GCM10010319_26100 [Streptomyces blastmyceticus]|uniref:Uncharacterized protein n=1 Tax=Streptomyces blastmyceticus TaxID=68180 RepID=A0ABN0WXD7_9ACTN
MQSVPRPPVQWVRRKCVGEFRTGGGPSGPVLPPLVAPTGARRSVSRVEGARGVERPDVRNRTTGRNAPVSARLVFATGGRESSVRQGFLGAMHPIGRERPRVTGRGARGSACRG